MRSDFWGTFVCFTNIPQIRHSNHILSMDQLLEIRYMYSEPGAQNSDVTEGTMQILRLPMILA
jgi:hypothetical protein